MAAIEAARAGRYMVAGSDAVSRLKAWRAVIFQPNEYHSKGGISTSNFANA